MRRNYPTCFEKISGRRWKQTWQWVAVLACLIVALGCRRAGDATGRRGYNDGLAALAAGDLDKAQTAFVGALNHAAGDPDLQFRAKANLGIVSLRQGDKKRADKAPDPAGAMRDSPSPSRRPSASCTKARTPTFAPRTPSSSRPSASSSRAPTAPREWTPSSRSASRSSRGGSASGSPRLCRSKRGAGFRVPEKARREKLNMIQVIH